jgi:hypothetical protein
MPRTTWQDLADEETAPAAPRPSAAAASLPSAAAARSAEATSGRVPSSLEDVPELRRLLAERQALEGTLDRLTGRSTPANEARDARRFPVSEPERPGGGALRERRNEESTRLAERRAMELETIDARNQQRKAEAQRLSAAERAARRRQAASERVARSARAWEEHRERLLEARDTARDLARQAGALGLPGSDVLGRAARGLGGASDALENVGRALRDLDQRLGLSDAEGSGRASAESLPDVGRLREIARDAQRFLDDPLRDTSAGQRLRALREELAPPELRPLPGERDSGGEDALERRRQRALEALRERRLDALASARPASRGADRAAE